MAPKKRKATTSEAAPEASQRAKPTKKSATAATKETQSKGEADSPARIVIEAWANKLEQLLTAGNSELTIVINPEKPRKGCFEVRDTELDDTFISLLNMPRPFQKLKAVNIEELSEEILAKVKKG